MTLQAADPWALFDYKPISSEELGPGRFRLLIPLDRRAYLLSQVPEPERGAFVRWAEQAIGPIRSSDFLLRDIP